MKLSWARAPSMEKASYVVFGVPDETGSAAKRKGSSRAPDAIRRVSNGRDVIRRNGVLSPLSAGGALEPGKIFDAGNIRRSEVASFVAQLFKSKKKFVMLGGDHSVSFEALKGASGVSEISFAYLDAHPDFICSRGHYYGSVVCDAAQLRHLRLRSSVELGVRAPESEELDNLRRSRVKTFSALAIQSFGLKKILSQALSGLSGPIYLSIDLDALDPAFAPGVSTPVPGGISSLEAMQVVRELSGENVFGLDLMELCPAFDQDSRTAHLAARLAMEWISFSELNKK